MKKYYIFLITFLIGLNIACDKEKTENQVSSDDEPYLVVLSMDGFRWDYPEKANTPNLDYVAQNGVKAEALMPSFPSKTFPNHYTMATGLYPDNHGIVGNNFWDDSLKLRYKVSDRNAVENGIFYGGEPIWVTAEKQGITTACFYWVGSEAKIKNIRPTYWKRYDHGFPFEQRIDTVIAWLKLPKDKRPHLIMWYMHEPDAVGHKFGPESQEVIDKVEYLDSLVGVFLNKINELPYADKINLVFTSDHGMEEISDKKVVFLDDYIDKNKIIRWTGSSPVFSLDVEDSTIDEVYQKLQVPHIKCWKHGTMPARYHFGNNKRDLDLIVVADSTWTIAWHDSKKDYSKGNHGFDNANKDMFAVFYAMGPAFKKNYVQPTFINVDLYVLFAKILNIKAANTDGNLNDVIGMLNKK